MIDCILALFLCVSIAQIVDFNLLQTEISEISKGFFTIFATLNYLCESQFGQRNKLLKSTNPIFLRETQF